MSTVTAGELHRLALIESEHGRHAAARRLLAAALRRDPEPALRARILLSVAYHRAETRNLWAGLELLDEVAATPGLSRHLRGLVESQRGLLYMRAARFTAALSAFDATLELLDESSPEAYCRALLNRSRVHEQRRTLPAGSADAQRCHEVAVKHGLHLLAAKATYNVACFSRFAGNLPLAMQELNAAAELLSRYSETLAGSCLLDRAHVLLDAGLIREADADLAQAADIFGRGGMRQDQAQAELARAEAALMDERWSDARGLASQARQRFRRRGAEVWTLLAESVLVSAAVGQGTRLLAVAARASRLAERLAAARLDDESRRAALTAATAYLRVGEHTVARTVAAQAVRLREEDPILTRLQARAVRAGIAEAEEDRRAAATERRAGLRELHRYQASFGSLDLQTAVSAYGRQLAEEGLAWALRGGRPAAVFSWAERSRALSTSLPSVVPPTDPEAAALLEELRQLRVTMRNEPGREQTELRGRRIELEQAIRQRSWFSAGGGRTQEPAALAAAQDELAAVDGTLVAHLLCGGRVHVLVAGGRRRALRNLGAAAPVLELGRRVRADLDILASRNLPTAVRRTVWNSCRDSLQRLDDLLLVPLGRLLAPGPLLLAPDAALVAAPWTMLATVGRRATTVVPSVTSWLANRKKAALPADPAVVLVTGPDVERGAEEIAMISAGWPDATTLTAARATAAAVRTAAADADVLHVAAHGRHEPDNPLFSNLKLEDGELFGHELDLLPRLPTHVVLSACELGLAETRPGSESLGMTAALLHGGAGSVVSGVARVSDDVACLFGAAHHASLRQRLSPAHSVAAALATLDPDEPAPLVCFGAGW